MSGNLGLWSAVTAAVLGAAAAEGGTPVDETRSAPAEGVVAIDNLSGTITVTGWEKKEVRVTGTLGEGVDRLEFTGEGDRTTVKVIYPRGPKWKGWTNEDIHESDLEVRVPRGSTVRAEGVNVRITADGVTGSLELKSVNGTIRAAGSPAVLDAGTVNGQIVFEGSCPRANLETVNGDLEVSGARGEIEVSTVNGDITVRGGELDRAKGSTIGGDITFDAGPAKRGTIELESHSGDVVLHLPPDVSAEFEVSTFSGDIVNDLGPKPVRKDRFAPGLELAFSVGSGDARIVVSTFSGTVEIRKATSR